MVAFNRNSRDFYMHFSLRIRGLYVCLRRRRTVYDYNVSLLAPLSEWRYGDEENDYADEARLRLLRIFTNVSQGVIKRERVLKRMKFQSPLLASAAITC